MQDQTPAKLAGTKVMFGLYRQSGFTVLVQAGTPASLLQRWHRPELSLTSMHSLNFVPQATLHEDHFKIAWGLL